MTMSGGSPSDTQSSRTPPPTRVRSKPLLRTFKQPDPVTPQVKPTEKCSKAPKSEPKAKPKELKSEPKAKSKGLKSEPKAKPKELKSESKAKPKELKSEPKAKPKELKSEPKAKPKVLTSFESSQFSDSFDKP